MTAPTPSALDGNAAAGLLAAVFGRDLTPAEASCTHCGLAGPLAGAVAYSRAPGLVLRCPGCGGVLARLVETPTAYYADLRGLAYLRVAR